MALLLEQTRIKEVLYSREQMATSVSAVNTMIAIYIELRLKLDVRLYQALCQLRHILEVDIIVCVSMAKKKVAMKLCAAA